MRWNELLDEDILSGSDCLCHMGNRWFWRVQGVGYDHFSAVDGRVSNATDLDAKILHWCLSPDRHGSLFHSGPHISRCAVLKLRDYPFELVQFSCAKCLRSGRYKRSSLIEKYTDNILLPDLRSYIAGGCERILNSARTDPWSISYPGLLRGGSSNLMIWRYV